ncbi:MAG: 4Fe-4S binding protein [Clostridiales bacterium]|nr:4Fe-4S binding protein [Clostridiales bacterium]
MIRKIIHINEDKCNGCGLCVKACHEGAIGLVGGKAKLLRDDYCDGLGDCLPTCPTNAISFVEREAAAYDEEAVKANQTSEERITGGCPGMQTKRIKQCTHSVSEGLQSAPVKQSRLAQWPVQIQLAPVNAPYFNDANLLIAADCTAYAYGDFHNRFMENRVTIIGCPKLDVVEYTEKLTKIITENNIKSVMIVRMEVPCCGGIEKAAKNALQASGKFISWQVVTISTDGRILK